MAEWLCLLARITKILYSNLETTRHRMTLDKSLTIVSQRVRGAQVIEWRNSA
jgi:hypothetical protein